jgi:hypothetical protein
MERPLTRTGMAGAIAALAVASVLGGSLVAYADNLQDTIADTADSALSLVAGSGVGKTAGIRVIGNNAQQDPDDGCNIDSGESPLVLDVLTPPGVTANPDPVSLLTCGTDYTVTFTAGANAQSGTATVSVLSGPAGGGTYQNQVSIPITVTHPNTRPTVAVEGVAAGSYEIGSVPAATCAVTDAEDGASSFPAVITGALSHGLGAQTATCNHTDSGNLAAPTASVSYAIVDTGDPTIAHTITGTGPNANGWYRSPVGIAFTCSDGSGSGIAYCGEDALFGDGADQAVTGTAEDWAGNTVQDVVSDIDVDTTAPGIVGVLSPAAPDGADGWYLGEVGVDFQCSDALSGIAGCDGDTTIGEGATGSATGSALDKAGNTAEASVSGVKVDASAPTIGYSLVSESAVVNGWFNKPVTVDFECDDAVPGSGIASCSEDIELGEGEDQSTTGTATDVAGHVTSVTASDIDVDTTLPKVSTVLTPAAPDGIGGWYVTAVGVDFLCEDALSGIDTCPDDTTIGEGATGGTSGTAVDKAGNSATATVSGLQVDTSDPTIGYTLTSAAAKVNGWYSKPVTVHFVCADAMSGLASCSDDAVLGDGADQSVTGTVADAAGRSATRTVEDIDVDTTAPTVGFAGSFGSTHHYGNVPAAPTCEAVDALSGLASCVVTGGGTTVGEHSFVATATDEAGNVATATLDYAVLPWNLTGFFNPVDMGVNVWNTVKNGSTVPLKFEIFAGAAELTTTSAVTSFTAVSTACPTAKAVVDEIEFVTTGGTVLRYDSTAGQYVQNWATPKKAGACVKVTMTTKDDSTLVANFILK